MKVYKFGGASISDAFGFKRVLEILKIENEPICLVVSALGKTTNLLEKLCHSFYFGGSNTITYFEDLKNQHLIIAQELFPKNHPVFEEMENAFLEIDWVIEDVPHTSYDFIYDQIVSIGEILSSKMLSYFLQENGIENEWVDSRGYIQTDNSYRNAHVEWEITKNLIKNKLVPILLEKWVICPGFIGGTSENYTTTLGREGSDYSGAIFASCLGSESLTVWKDVPGIMNSDPKINPNALFIPELSYHEVAELSYYGASVIHPKTIKPLIEQEIPLWVKSFLHPEKAGTLVSKKSLKSNIPFYILKKEQMLLSLYSLDGSFILEDHLTRIYEVFAKKGISISLAVNSALSFSVLIDQNRYAEQIMDLIKSLADYWKVRFNQDLNLLTIRHNGNEILDLDQFIGNDEIIVEISTRHTLQKLSRKRPIN